jgi:uncharacterized protein YkwD
VAQAKPNLFNAPAILGWSVAIFVLTISSSAIYQPVSAQESSTRPIARLLRSPAEGMPYGRPRRATAASFSAPAGTANAGTASFPSMSEAMPIERRAFEVTNQARRQSGLAPLAWAPDLCRMARAHSENMARLSFFSHETPEGMRLRDRARAAGILHFKLLGENIAYNQGYEDPGAFAVGRWMISPGHRANILSDEFEASAIGVFVAADGAVYLTQAFIAR